MEVARLQVAFEATGQAGVQRAVHQTDTDIKNLANNSVGAANRIGSAFGGAGKLIAATFAAAAVVGIGKIGTGFLMANANAETLMTTMEIATGSITKANDVYGEMQKMAAATPFELPELVAGAARIEAFGISSVKVMGTIGDTAAGTMKSIDQVTAAYLDAGMGQYIRLQELGVDATVVGDQVELSYIKNGKKIVESVDKTNGLLIQSTLEGIWNDKYAGAMEKQSKTFNGMFSTLKDNFNLTMQDMTKGVFNFAKKGLVHANKFFDRFNKKLKMGLSPWKAAMSSLETTLNQVFGRGVGGAVVGFFRAFGDGVAIVKDFVGGLLDAFKAGKSVEALANRLPGSLQGVAAAVFGIADAFGDLWRAYQAGGISGLFAQLDDEAKQIAAAGIDLGVIVVKAVFDLASGMVTDLWGWFVGKIMGTSGGGAWDGRSLEGLPQAQEPISFGTVMVTAALKLGGQIAEWAGNLWGWVKSQLGLGGGGSWDGRSLAGMPTEPISLGAWTIDTAIPTVTGWLKDTAGHVWAGLKAAAGWFVTGAVEMGSWTLNTAIPAISGWLTDTAGHAWAGLKAAAGWFITSAVEMGGWTLNTMVPTITGWLKDTAADVWAGLKAAAGWAWDNKSDLGTITLSAIAAVGGDLKAIADDAETWIKGAIKWTSDKTIKIGKLTLVGDVEIKDSSGGDAGKSFTQKIADGIRATPGVIFDAIKFVLVQVPTRLGEFAAEFVNAGARIVGMIAQSIRKHPPIEIAAAIGAVMLAAAALPILLAGAPIVFGFNFMKALVSGLDINWPVIGNWFKSLPTKAALAMVGAATALKDRGIELIAGLMLGWGTKALELMTLAEHFPARVAGHIFDAATALYARGIELIQGLMDGWTAKSLELEQWAKNLPTWLAGKIVDAADALKGIGEDIVGGIVSGISGAKSAIVAEVQRLLDLIPGWAREAMGIDGPPHKAATYRTTPGQTSNQPGMVGGEPVTALPNVGAGVPKITPPDTTAFVAAMATVRTVAATTRESVILETQTMSQFVGFWVGQAAQRATAGFTQLKSSAISIANETRSGVLSAFTQLQSGVGMSISATTATVAAGFGAMRSIAVGMAGSLVSGVLGTLSVLPGSGYGIGVGLGNGIAAGISATIGAVASAAANLVSSAINAAKTAGQISSPSRLMLKLGGYMAEGFAVGITRGAGQVNRSMAGLVGAPIRSRASAGAYGGGGQNVYVTFGAGSYVGPGAMKEIRHLAAQGAVKIIDQRQMSHDLAGARR